MGNQVDGRQDASARTRGWRGWKAVGGAAAALACCAIVASACRSEIAPVAEPCALPVRVRVEPGEGLNPDDSGAALPTQLRLYQTRSANAFEEAAFEVFWESPEQALGDALVDVQQLTVFPGTPQELEITLEPATRYVAAVGIFRRPAGRQWRAYLSLPDAAERCGAFAASGPPSPALVIKADGYQVELRSSLMAASGAEDLPGDVAPERGR